VAGVGVGLEITEQKETGRREEGAMGGVEAQGQYWIEYLYLLLATPPYGRC